MPFSRVLIKNCWNVLNWSICLTTTCDGWSSWRRVNQWLNRLDNFRGYRRANWRFTKILVFYWSWRCGSLWYLGWSNCGLLLILCVSDWVHVAGLLWRVRVHSFLLRSSLWRTFWNWGWWNNYLCDCELHQDSWVFVIIETHCSVIFVVTLVIKQSDPHFMRSVDLSIKEYGSWNTNTSNVWFIILDIFDDQNNSGILIVGIILKLES